MDKKFVSGFIAGVLLTLVVGILIWLLLSSNPLVIGRVNRSNPESVARAYVTALLKRDFQSFIELLPPTDEFSISSWNSGDFFCEATATGACAVPQQWLNGDFEDAKIENVLVESAFVSDKRWVTVLFVHGGQEYILTGITLIQYSGDWYVVENSAYGMTFLHLEKKD